MALTVILVKITNYLCWVPCGVCNLSRRIRKAVLIEALQENKSALGYTMDDGSAELLYTFTFSQYCGKLQVFIMVSTVTSDRAGGETYLISCCFIKSHHGGSIFIAGTSVYHNPDLLGKHVKNFRRTRH